MSAPPVTPATVAAVVLCGGTSARMGGMDKTAMDVVGTTVLDALLSQLPTGWAVVCVGEPRPVVRAVTWTRESPPLGGPVAGLQAGVAAAPLDAAVVVALAGDQPFAGPTAVTCADTLSHADPEVDGIAARQPDGRPQALLAAYRRAPLTRALAGVGAGAGVYRTLADLRIGTVDADDRATLDVDTPADLHRARGQDPGTS